MVEDDEGANSPNCKGFTQTESEQFSAKSSRNVDQDAGRNEGDISRQSSSLPCQVIPEDKKFLSGSLLPDNAFPPKKVTGDGDR